MFLSPHQIDQVRQHALNHLLVVSGAHLDSNQRFANLISTTSREYLAIGSKHMAQFGETEPATLSQYPAALWFDNMAHHTRLLESCYEIIAEAHKQLIASAEAQIKLFDELVFASLNRAAHNSPWEAEIALSAMRSTLESAEATLHGMSDAAIAAITASEQEEVHQIAEHTKAAEPAKKPASRSRRTAKSAA
jgi:hypothetical protein